MATPKKNATKKPVKRPVAKKSIPLQSISKPPSMDETVGDVLTKIRQLPPNEQNTVVQKVIEEIAFDRYNRHISTTKDRDIAAKLLDEFVDFNPYAAKIISSVSNQQPKQ